MSKKRHSRHERSKTVVNGAKAKAPTLRFGQQPSAVLESAATRTAFLCPEEEEGWGATTGPFLAGMTSPISPLCHITHQNRRNPRICFACVCAHSLTTSGAAIPGDTDTRHRRARGRPSTSTERKTPTHHPWEFERSYQGSQSLFRRWRTGMTSSPSVVDGCAGTFGRRHDAARKWRHFLAPSVSAPPAGPPRIFPGRHSCGLGSSAQ